MTMASKLSPLCNFFLLLMLFSYSPSLASSSTSPSTICNSTPHPSFCKSNLPPNEFNTIQDYGWYFIHQSLSSAKDFLLLIKSYPISHSSYSKRTVHALKDCQLLADLTVDFLSKTLRTISSTNSLNSLQAEDLHTLLSATLTNQETCSDGLLELASDSSVKKGMLGPLSNGTKLHSISLALFKHGWVPKTKRESFPTERNHLLFSNMENIINGLLPLRMSITGRRLLQTTLGDVLVSQTVLVNPDGSGDFTTINDAVAAAPENTDISDGYFVIYIVPGVYYEYVSIDKNKQYLMMVGYGINQTVITGDHNQKDDLSTFDSATFAVVGQGFVAMNITFRNTAGPHKGQAVAVLSGADMSAFYQCSFEGYQDTLHTHSLRQFYKECDIYGTIDFIFGNAAVVFQDCNIYLRLPLHGQYNVITAQGKTDPNQNTGTSIHLCSIRAAEELNGTETYLGRPWKEYSTAVYIQSFMDSLINFEGWHTWNDTDFAINTLYYGEYDNNGPGSDTSNRVTWPGYHVMNRDEANDFNVSHFIQGDEWLPATGVPYTGGLL
ncbi:pectinesterase-like isoform X1 [Quercus robur]|uniref:pectinesterase-like isoform X1 n=1 Tax=Quercus robur TaxID=38942 RepID=UPI0021610D6D|nr:pectinesterase-like isoform X1 [Quercus robur]